MGNEQVLMKLLSIARHVQVSPCAEAKDGNL